MNNIVILGNIGKDIDFKISQQGKAVAKFSVAVPKFKQGETNWFKCVAFGKTAETINKFFHKGSKICLQGSIEFGSYQNKEGNAIYTTDLFVNSFSFCESNKQQSNSNNNDMDFQSTINITDEDLPF